MRGGADLLEKGLLLLLTIFSLLPPILIGFSSTHYQENPSRGTMIAPAYTIICILGVVAALYPNPCSRLLRSLGRREYSGADRDLLSSLPSSILSHHPPCRGLQAHEFKLAGRRFCVGCTGMTVGAAASSILVIAYFGGEWGLSVVVLGPLVLGILLVAFGLTQSLLLDVKWQVVRFFLNALFVVGVSLILIGEDVLGRSLLVDSYVLVLALLWLYIRIRSSQLSHQTICTRCNLICPLDETSS